MLENLKVNLHGSAGVATGRTSVQTPEVVAETRDWLVVRLPLS
jgi:hypothetical protein